MPTVTTVTAVAQFKGQNSQVIKGTAFNFRFTPTIGGIVEDLMQKCGVHQALYDITAGTDEVDGWQMAERGDAIGQIEELLRVFKFVIIEVDGKLKLVRKGGAVVATIPDEDLGAHPDDTENEPTPKTMTERLQPLDLPTEVDLVYYSQASFYEQTNARAQRVSKPNQEKLTVNTALVMEEAFARQAAEFILYDQWITREKIKILVPTKYIYLAPGDPIQVTVAGVTARYRIIGMDIPFFGPITIEAVLDDTVILTQTITGGVLPTHDAGTTISTNTTLTVWASNALRDVDALLSPGPDGTGIGFYYVVGPPTAGEDWPGCVLYISRDGGATYQVLDSISDAGDFGTTLTALPAPPASIGTGLFDETNTVDIRITSGNAPVSASELEVLNGANAAMIGDEMIQYVTVTALGGDDYRLSRLLRGRRATNNYWSTHAIGERAVLLDNGGNSRRSEVEESLLGRTIQLKAVTNSQSISGVSATNLLIPGNEYKPYDGVDGAGTRHVPAANDWTVTWKRRTRCGGVWTDLVDADLCETTEAYEAEIWTSGFAVLKRTFTGLTDETFVYTSADQVTDFGSNQGTINVRVYQLGRYGRGYSYSFTLTAP